MDSAFEAFRKGEERLQKLSARPSEIARRQFRVTPYPHEPSGWIIDNSGEEMLMFSSDFPHVEGGRNPIKRFEDNLGEAPERARDAFYRDNFVDLMGAGLAPELRARRSRLKSLSQRLAQRLVQASERISAGEAVRPLPAAGPHPSSGSAAGRGRTAGAATAPASCDRLSTAELDTVRR
ncbi:MAG: hypothetical protein U5R48_16920 [Gammaproteobacteria bacterium]|nr:hypothetical protein [Gammaproteobacteria bacterium]